MVVSAKARRLQRGHGCLRHRGVLVGCCFGSMALGAFGCPDIVLSGFIPFCRPPSSILYPHLRGERDPAEGRGLTLSATQYGENKDCGQPTGSGGTRNDTARSVHGHSWEEAPEGRRPAAVRRTRRAISRVSGQGYLPVRFSSSARASWIMAASWGVLAYLRYSRSCEASFAGSFFAS